MRTYLARLAPKIVKDHASSRQLQPQPTRRNASHSTRHNGAVGHRGGRDGQERSNERRSQSSSPKKTSPSVAAHASFLAQDGRGRIFGDNRPVQQDARLLSVEKDALVTKIHKLSKPDRILRPNFGKSGTATTLRANLFALDYPNDLVLYDYSLKFSPDISTSEKRTLKRVFQLLESSPEFSQFSKHVAHDGAQRLISSRRLPPNLTIRIPFHRKGEPKPKDGGKVYEMKVIAPVERKLADLDKYLRGDNATYNPEPVVSAFNLITTSHAAHTAFIPSAGRCFVPPSSFRPPERPCSLNIGLEVWKGFFTSVRSTFKQLMVNVNTCTSPFYTPVARLSDALLEYKKRKDTRGRVGDPQEAYKQARVTTKHLGFPRQHTIKGFGPKTARETKFRCDELGATVSVEQFFKQKYKITLQHATDLPVVNVGGKDRDAFIPAELCEIESGQPYRKTLTSSESAEMVKYGCRSPYDNATSIEKQGLPLLGFRQEPAQPMPGFGTRVLLDMAIVPGRILSSPRIMYRDGPARIENGRWRLQGQRFHTPASIKNFAVLALSDGSRDAFSSKDDISLKRTVDNFVAQSVGYGMTVTNKSPEVKFLKIGHKNRSEFLESIEGTLKSFSPRPDIVLVFVPNSDIYPDIKTLCDLKLGIATSCLHMREVRKERGQDRYLSDVMMKVNTKLGGINHRLDAALTSWLKNTMLVGMDVTHPGAGRKAGRPSIAAVVTSCDANFMQYPTSLRVQEQGEMITEIKEMMIERLDEYKKRMKNLPDKVIVFRDGVSEGEMAQVLKEELPKMKDAFRTFGDYAPKLTIVCCVKGHHIRFFPTSRVHADHTGNSVAGTIVDHGATSVYNFDFFLQAHAGLQGTARPTHYTVIYDENRFDADAIQKGTNDLSYLWANSAQSVSIVPPAYWADRACDRARLYLQKILSPESGSAESRMTKEQLWKRANEQLGSGVHEKLKSSMFYM